MRNVPLKIVALLLAFVAGTGTAAADEKVYPGLMCLASNTDNNQIERAPVMGYARNASNQAINFVCPAVRDASRISDATIYVIDFNPTTDVRCTLYSRHPSGAPVYSATRTSTGRFSGEPLALDFPQLQASADNAYWFSCVVPGRTLGNLRSGVATYSIDEAGPDL